PAQRRARRCGANQPQPRLWRSTHLQPKPVLSHLCSFCLLIPAENRRGQILIEAEVESHNEKLLADKPVSRFHWIENTTTPITTAISTTTTEAVNNFTDFRYSFPLSSSRRIARTST